MDKCILEVFNGLNLTDRQKKIFADVRVHELLASTKKRTLTVKTVCNHIVEYREVIVLRNKLQDLFKDKDFKIIIEESFNLSDTYTPEIFVKEYKQSIYDNIKDISVVDFSILESSDVKVKDSQIEIQCENTKLNCLKVEELSKAIEKIIRDKSGFDMSVKVEAVKEPVFIDRKPQTAE
ncbi:MAG: hypothetical protein K6F77_08305, partial [Lachnospiraceae bacterium]|nr:hypothetical protein [Lachnospiraceae bacterium]